MKKTKSVILDKSFLDGANTESVIALCNNHDVFISDELFFELMTTNPSSRQRCFSKLPKCTNPVALIPNVSWLLDYEMQHDEACTPVARHRLTGAFQFNAKLRDGEFVIEGHVADQLEAWKEKTADDTKDFIERWSVVHQFFPELNGIEWSEFPIAIEQARTKVATNTDFVRDIYTSFLAEKAPQNAPSPERIGWEWAIFRWIQCQILCALRQFGRYQGKIPDTQGRAFLERAEHSMLDSYHVIHGALVGAMATLDHEIREDLQLVHTACTIIPAADT